MRLFLLLLGALLLSACSSVEQKTVAASAISVHAVSSQEQINTFATQLAQQKVGLSYNEILKTLSKAKTQERIIALMNKPYEALPWWRYQTLYERPSLVTDGMDFWQANQKNLAEASKVYGVPAQIILAILGVETQYGKNKGSYRALDALYTLSFSYPRRASYFQKELAAYLILTHQAGFDPLAVNSSYAGALGMPQFMPSSYQKYAVSHLNHYPNLFTNNADAIDSVAHYLATAGWVRGAPIAVPARLSKHVQSVEELQNHNFTLQEFKQHGIDPVQQMSGKLVAQLVILEGEKGPEYFLAFRNFYVIKRYNASNLYAMAVTELSRKLLNAWVVTEGAQKHYKVKKTRHK